MKRELLLVETIKVTTCATVTSAIFYGLWALHHDHPGWAAILGGVAVTGCLWFYDKMLGYLFGVLFTKVEKADKRIASLQQLALTLNKRLDEDEQRIDEMEDPDSDDLR